MRRKKIQQPWSLLLQVVSIALLLLAIADLELGRPAERVRDHVLILETSAWMNSASNVPHASWMQVARRRALDYLKAVPAQDRVLLVRADQLATPARGCASVCSGWVLSTRCVAKSRTCWAASTSRAAPPPSPGLVPATHRYHYFGSL